MRLLLAAIWIPLWCAVVAFCAFIGLHAVTWTGRLACSVLPVATTCVLLALAWGTGGLRDKPARKWSLLLGGLWCVGILVYLLLSAPTGTGGDETLLVKHVFPDPSESFPRYAVSNLVPEVDQVMSGVGLAYWLDKHIPAEKAQRLRSLCRKRYQETNAVPAFCSIGSVLTYSYREMRGHAPEGRHYVAVLPRGQAPRAAMVVLHGSGGNFASYWHALSSLARNHGVALFFPSFGSGNWYRAGGTQAVRACREDAQRRFQLGTVPLFLLTLSNGGTGITRLPKEELEHYAGAVLLSSVLEEEPLQAQCGQGAWQKRSVLLLHGDLDARIPVEINRARERLLRGAGARVDAQYYPTEDHFLFYSAHSDIVSRIAAWMEPISAAGK